MNPNNYTVHTAVNKETGTTVHVYDTHHPDCPHKGPKRWLVWCADHARFVFVKTRFAATERYARHPGSTGWCHECKLRHEGWM